MTTEKSPPASTARQALKLLAAAVVLAGADAAVFVGGMELWQSEMLAIEGAVQ